jgi:ketol-acid reductoisomerase
MTTVALFGAAGKMGARIADKLRDDPEYRMLYVEAGEAGLARLQAEGLAPTPKDEAVREADVVILAIPDVLIGPVSTDIVPSLQPGAMVVCLDPAAPYAGELPAREDVTYFVVHPCHPPLVSDERDPETHMDFFGGTAQQNIVCALMQGPEADYGKGEHLARKMFAPVRRAHRITVEQMALLEPAMAETVVLTCMVVIKEAMEEAVRRGVPGEAALDFLLGHMKVNVGILFGYVDAEFSDGAKLAVQRAMQRIIQPDWREVFEPQNVLSEIEAITRGA